jgi:hypothetical protein
VALVQDIEELIGKKLEEYEVDEDKVNKTITKVRLLSWKWKLMSFKLVWLLLRL